MYSGKYKFEFSSLKYLPLHTDFKGFSVPDKNFWTLGTVRNIVGWRKLCIFIGAVFNVDISDDAAHMRVNPASTSFSVRSVS